MKNEIIVKSEKRKNGTKRIQYCYSNCDLITDQAPAKELTMASIVKKLEKGIMPNLRQGLIYSTDHGVRNLQDIVERQQEVTNLYQSLPTEIKQLMGNDLNNLENVIFDEKNSDLLKKYGLITEKRDHHSELLSAISQIKPSEGLENPSQKAQK